MSSTFIDGNIITLTDEMREDIGTLCQFVERYNHEELVVKAGEAARRLEIILAKIEEGV